MSNMYKDYSNQRSHTVKNRIINLENFDTC